MSLQTRHVSVRIDRPVGEVYAYASQPPRLTEWAAGLTSSIEQLDGEWVSASPMGRLVIEFAPPNDFGVLDHRVTMPSGETVDNPMRVVADGAGAEVVFTVRQRPGMSDEEFEGDCAAVHADLTTLKRLLESP
jgi:hypothetical protein